MTLLELYELKLLKYNKTKERDNPSKLLAMLLLSEMDKYEPLDISQEKFYNTYKKDIDKQISKVEKDFNFTYEDIISYIEKLTIYNDYVKQSIWYVFADGFRVLHWALLYRKEEVPEEIYCEYFSDNELSYYSNLDKRDSYLNKNCIKLTVEDRLFMLKELKNRSCINCSNENCRFLYSKEKFIYGNKCIGWYNSSLIGISRILKKN